MSQLWLEKSHVQEFSQKSWLYRLKEKSWVHLPILWLQLRELNVQTRILTKLFFHFFQTWNFFVFIYFWTYQVDFYGFGIVFYQIWDVFNLYKPVLGAFFDVSTDFHVFYVWTRNGSKMRFQNLVFKGLKLFHWNAHCLRCANRNYFN